jgi:Meckel syndrome type 1 protein
MDTIQGKVGSAVPTVPAERGLGETRAEEPSAPPAEVETPAPKAISEWLKPAGVEIPAAEAQPQPAPAPEIGAVIEERPFAVERAEEMAPAVAEEQPPEAEITPPGEEIAAPPTAPVVEVVAVTGEQPLALEAARPAEELVAPPVEAAPAAEAGIVSAEQPMAGEILGVAPPALEAEPEAAFAPPAPEVEPEVVFAPPALEAGPEAAFAPPTPEVRPEAAFAPPALEAGPEAAFAPPAPEVGPEAAFAPPTAEVIIPPVEEMPPGVIEPAPVFVPPAAVKPRRKPKWLGLLEDARALRDAGRLEESLTVYEQVIQRAPKLLGEVIGDLEELVQRGGIPLEAHRLLGDAYTRADRLQDALDQYNYVYERVA